MIPLMYIFVVGRKIPMPNPYLALYFYIMSFEYSAIYTGNLYVSVLIIGVSVSYQEISAQGF